MTEAFRVENLTMGVNYGMNRSFPAPVPTGSKIRAKVTLTGIRQTPPGWLASIRARRSWC